MTNPTPHELLLAIAEEYGHEESLLDGTLDELARSLDIIEQMSGVLREASGWLKTEIADRMPENDMTIAGVGELQRRPRFASWRDSEAKGRLASELAASIAAEVSTSELTGERDPLAHRAAEMATIKTLANVSWSGALASAKKLARPVNPNEFKGGITGYSVTLLAEDDPS